MRNEKLDILKKELRKNLTESEAIVWSILRNRKFMNLKFRRQHRIENYIVDFFCHEYSLILEVDGKVHDHQKDYDEIREQFLRSKGYRIIRITNQEVKDNLNLLLEKIRDVIKLQE